MFSEFERVALKVAIPNLGLREGAKGVIVDVHGAGRAYSVEFFDKFGNTVAVEVIPENQLMRLSKAHIVASEASNQTATEVHHRGPGRARIIYKQESTASVSFTVSAI